MESGSGARLGFAAVVSFLAIAAALAGCTPGTTSSGSTTKVDTLPPAASSAPAAATSTRIGACLAGQLTATLSAGAGGGAGHIYPFLVLTNKGSTACTVKGYPGVSFVGNGNGTQLGAAATREAAGITITTLTLAPGQSAHSQLSITVAGNYDPTTCKPKAADGLRVYPPDETHSLFIASTAYTACQNASIVLILVRPLQAGAA